MMNPIPKLPLNSVTDLRTSSIEEQSGNSDTSTIIGNVGDYNQGVLTGWMHCSENTATRFTVNIFEKNSLIGTGISDVYRQDLELSGIGDGRYGFSIRLDDQVLDGKQHSVTALDADTGHILGSREFVANIYCSSNIDAIEAGHISGSVTLTNPSEATGYEVEILIDGEPGVEGACLKVDQSNTYTFNIQLPPSLFDDCYHIYSVRIKGRATNSRLFQEKLASIITPWEYLADGIESGSLSSLSRLSGYRYKSLQSHMRHLSHDQVNSEYFNNVLLAHDMVVEGYENRISFPKLHLPAVAKPKISIVIPVHNKFELTYHCIASLILGRNNVSFEVIVVDDLSSDKTTHIDEYISNVKVIKNEVNLGFLLSSTAGADQAIGDYIVFLNNDTEVTEGWLDSLVHVFNTFSHVGMVGSKLIYPTGKLQEAGGIVWGSGKPWNLGNRQNSEDPQFNYTRQVDYLSGAAFMIDANVWFEIGGFSREYVPAYYEDTDLAFKVREAGYRTYYCSSSLVVHFEGMSNGRELNSGIKKFQSINAPKFRSKWRHQYRNNGAEGIDLRKNMDRNVDFRVLMIDYTTPKPDQDAGGYAAIKEMSLIQELGCKVTFIPNNMAHMGKYTHTLQNNGVECIYAPFYSNISEFLKDRGNEFDLVYITRYDVAEDVIQCVKKYTPAKIILNNADLHFLRELRAALSANDDNLDGPINTRERELSVMRNVDAILSYNEVEHSVIVSHNLKDDNIFRCPWVLESKLSKVPFEDRDGIAFLGSFNHTPNKEAIKYFVNTVMPLIRIKEPGIKLHIYGSKMTKEIEALASNDVIIEGYVKSLSSVFDTCRVFVAPLLSGAGIKGKVLESIAYGVPCVLSPVAAESTGLTHGVNTLIANNPDQWAEYISCLYTDSQIWQKNVNAKQPVGQ